MNIFSNHLLGNIFLTTGFAWAGLALISVPIIIHLLNRRRFKVVTWAAMEFLLRAMKKNRRRLRFEQLLLLATRCLLVLLLGLALARPMGCENSALARFGRHSSLNVFVIDNSYSAAYDTHRGDVKTHLDQAKKVVKEMLSRQSAGGESVIVITAAKPAVAVLGKPQFDLEEAKSAIDRIEQSYSSTDLAGALQLAIKVAKDENFQPNKNLFILTDATRSAWEGPQAQAVAQEGAELARLYHVTHFNLTGGQPQWNGAVLDISPSSNLVTTKFQTDFKAVVKGFGGSHDGTLHWKLDDQPLEDSGTIKLDAATPDQIQSKAHFAAGGPHVITAELTDDDRLAIDNIRNKVVDVASELKVLIVEGKRGISALDGSGAFLFQALAPTGASEPGKPVVSDSYVSPELITDLELGNKILTDYAVVILTDVGNISPSQADAMEKFVRQGGTLMTFMGEEVSGSENYNATLVPHKLLPGKLVKLVSAGSNEKPFVFDFKPKGVLHPFLNVFANQENTGLDTARVDTYWQVEIDPKLGVERVLSYLPRDGSTQTSEDPAITVHSLGQGRVVFVSTSANPDWTSFPNKIAYVPLMHELLAGSVRSGDGWMNLAVGQPMEIPTTVRVTATPTMTDPTGASIVVDPDMRDGHVVYHTAVLKKPGLYKLSLGDRTVPIAVNVPAEEEANVTTVTDEAIRHALGDIDLTLKGQEAPAEAAVGREGNDFSWWCMMAVFGLVCFECYIAMKFGHNRRSESPGGVPSAGTRPGAGRPGRVGAAVP